MGADPTVSRCEIGTPTQLSLKGKGNLRFNKNKDSDKTILRWTKEAKAKAWQGIIYFVKLWMK